MNIDGIVSTTASILLIATTIVIGGPIGIFASVTVLVFTACIALGIQLTVAGAGAFSDLWRTLYVLGGKPNIASLGPQHAVNLRSFSFHLYVGGSIGTLLLWIQILGGLDTSGRYGPSFAFSLMSIFYGVVLAELIARPASNRINYLLTVSAENKP